MSRSKRGDGHWTREDSLRADGRLTDGQDPSGRPASEQERRDPPGDHVETYREAMALWREDAAITASSFDGEALTRRVLDGRGSRETVARTTRRYAAAAVLLIGVGVAGAATVGREPAPGDQPSVRSALETLEKNRLGLIAEQEWTRFGVTAAPRAEEER